jgi:hypothetical protein
MKLLRYSPVKAFLLAAVLAALLTSIMPDGAAAAMLIQ